MIDIPSSKQWPSFWLTGSEFSMWNLASCLTLCSHPQSWWGWDNLTACDWIIKNTSNHQHKMKVYHEVDGADSRSVFWLRPCSVTRYLLLTEFSDLESQLMWISNVGYFDEIRKLEFSRDQRPESGHWSTSRVCHECGKCWQDRDEKWEWTRTRPAHVTSPGLSLVSPSQCRALIGWWWPVLRSCQKRMVNVIATGQMIGGNFSHQFWNPQNILILLLVKISKL